MSDPQQARVIDDERHEYMQIVLKLLACAGLMAFCVGGPIAIAKVVAPWAGALVAISTGWLWRRFGPPPSPGYLSGIVCLLGLFGIAGAFIACVVLSLGGK